MASQIYNLNEVFVLGPNFGKHSMVISLFVACVGVIVISSELDIIWLVISLSIGMFFFFDKFDSLTFVLFFDKE